MFYFSSLVHLAIRMSGVRPLKKQTKNQPMSDQLAIYCDAPGFKVRTYITEELIYDQEKNSFPEAYSFWRFRQQSPSDKETNSGATSSKQTIHALNLWPDTTINIGSKREVW